MGYITKYGGFWGMIPQTSGNVYWVSPGATYTVEGRTYSASDNHDGLSPERALRTVDYAIGLTTANAGDVIVLLPGSHSVSATITVDVAGLTITGIPGNAPTEKSRMSSGAIRNRSRIDSTETAGMIFTVTAVDTEIAWLHLAPITAGAGISFSNAADRGYVHDCTFNLGATTETATFGITFPLGTGTATHNDDTLISNCYFQAGANVGPAIRAAGTCDGLTIQSSTFELIGAAAWDDAIETTQINLGTHVRDCDFFTPTSVTTVMTDCIDTTGGTTDGSCQVYRCYFPEGSDAFEATATIDITACENYLSTATGGALTGSV